MSVRDARSLLDDTRLLRSSPRKELLDCDSAATVNNRRTSVVENSTVGKRYVASLGCDTDAISLTSPSFTSRRPAFFSTKGPEMLSRWN